MKDIFCIWEGFVKKKTATVVNAKECSIHPTSSAPGVLEGCQLGRGAWGTTERGAKAGPRGHLHQELLAGIRRCSKQPGELGHTMLSRD